MQIDRSAALEVSNVIACYVYPSEVRGLMNFALVLEGCVWNRKTELYETEISLTPLSNKQHVTESAARIEAARIADARGLDYYIAHVTHEAGAQMFETSLSASRMRQEIE